jgi:sucrose-6-phosphate hydrolase SacC (GH32 family)
MVHWKWHPTVLTPAFTGHGMFSGTGFFTKEGQPAMIYFGYNENVEEEDLRIWLMYALDDNLDKWTKPEMIVPKDDAGEEVKFDYHDPDLWLMGDTYYAMSGGNTFQHIMKSKDLKNWKYIGPFFHKDYPEHKLGVSRTEDLQCVNTFKIGNKWMVLGISHPMGCRYYLGVAFDTRRPSCGLGLDKGYGAVSRRSSSITSRTGIAGRRCFENEASART